MVDVVVVDVDVVVLDVVVLDPTGAGVVVVP